MNPKGNPETLKKFSSTYQPKRNGRKPNHLKQYIRNHNVSSDDIKTIIGSILVEAKDINAAKKLLEDPKTPFLVKVFLKPLLHDYVHNKTDTAKWLTEYGFGKAVQEVIAQNTNTNIDIQNMTKTEREDLKKNILKQLIEKNKDQVKEIMNGEEDQGLSEETGTEKSDQAESE